MAQVGGGVGDAAGSRIWVTLSGLPLTIRLDWPFHPSKSGADFWVLHGDVGLVGSDGLHCPVAVNLSQTVREVMPSMEPKDAEAPVINALRKEVDRRQIEFLKSGKLLPVPFSSRHYDFKRGQWVFGKASDEVMAELVERKVFWETKLGESKSPPSRTEREKDGATAASETRVWLGDPAEAQYLQTTPAHLVEVARRLVAGQGLLRVEGEYAEATAGLMNQAERFEKARLVAMEDLEKKHAFERG
ncbi:MAG: hypothetical protein WAN03_17565 [Candidatus Sulfotelmatobacter sp.]